MLPAAKIVPFGAGASGAAVKPERANASNKIGAADARPYRPGTGAPSGRPTQTPIVMGLLRIKMGVGEAEPPRLILC